ncbi:hypothetical protein ANCCEY_03381 [Ancylostoma ceylanicum]|uniref:Glycosyltransferase family 92 protein n=1 Tax=Ancylostoma ceylanicum TaxID=53326 RepID=A0A0D6M0D6_9BILA|nr:hypothetical protein ANCCEY_03381 [Ancylostoma ceylanicum]
MEADGWYGEEVYCRYFDKNRIEIEPPVKSVVYPEFVVYCCNNAHASYMSITESVDEEVMQLVSTLNRTVNNPEYILSLCLSPLYGTESKWLLLAELIEHYKLQGVEHFYVYIKDIDAYSQKLIHDYVKSGDVETIYFSNKQHRMGKDWQLAGVKGNETLREQLPTLAFYNASAISMIYTKCAVNPRRLPECCRRWRSLPLVFLACGIAFGLMYGYFAKKGTLAMSNNNKNITLPEHTKDCVPFYELLRKHASANTGNRKSSQTKLSLLAAYAYPDYAVVTLEADGWYGPRIDRYLRRQEMFKRTQGQGLLHGSKTSSHLWN